GSIVEYRPQSGVSGPISPARTALLADRSPCATEEVIYLDVKINLSLLGRLFTPRRARIEGARHEPRHGHEGREDRQPHDELEYAEELRARKRVTRADGGEVDGELDAETKQEQARPGEREPGEG